ncbi:MAG: LysM domain-containing protein [Duganella sp.]
MLFSLPASTFAAPGSAVPGSTAACEFRADAPERHLVVRGDTLWDIAGRFLQQPWCWPTVWDMNREDIANPHWIYPDQVIWFDRAAGRLRLGDERGPSGAAGAGATALPTERRSPGVRSAPIGADGAVPAIPPGAIEPFLSEPLIIENDELRQAPRIIATEDGHVFIGKGDKAYVRGALGGMTMFQVYRPGRPLTDPVSGAVIGHEAYYLGTVRLLAAAAPGSDVHTVSVTSSREEMGKGDQLRPLQPAPLQNYVPHAPAAKIDARVVAVHGGVRYAGRQQIVSINRGKLDELDIGAVLRLYHAGKTVRDATAPKDWLGREQQVRLPDEQVGSLFIFRVFDRISYGLIMQATAPVVAGDIAVSPE